MQPPHDFYDNSVDKKTYGDRRETTRAKSEIVGTPHGYRMVSIRFLLKVSGCPTISVWFPHDLCTVLTQNVDKRQNKKSYDARMNCKHIHVVAHDHLDDV